MIEPMEKYVVFLMIALASFSCAKEKQTLTELDFSSQITSNPTKTSITDIAQSLDFIQLETSDSILIGNRISHILMHNNFLFVVHGNKCSQFDISGKFIRDIGRRGQGPGEYIYILEISIQDNLLYMLDEAGRLFCYNMDGVLVNNIRLPKNYSSVFPENDHTFIGFQANISGGEKYLLTYFDDKGMLTDSIYNMNQMKPSGKLVTIYSKEGCFFYGDNDKTYFKELVNDTIFEVTAEHKLEPRVKLNWGNSVVNLIDRMTDPNNFLSKEKVCPTEVFESKSFLFVKILFQQQNSICYLDKTTNTCSNVVFTYTSKQQGNEEKTFAPLSISTDLKCLLAYEQSDGEENPIVVIARLKEN